MLLKVKDNKILKSIKAVLSDKYFPFISASVILGCYYLGLDTVNIFYICIISIVMLILLDDLTPLIPNFLLMNLLISEQHNPLQYGDLEGSDYFARLENIVPIAVIVIFLVIAVFVRIFFSVKRNKVRPTLTFWSLCALAVAFVCNGIGSKHYVVNNFVYSILLAFTFLAIYVVTALNTSVTEDNLAIIGWGFMAFSALIVFELVNKYATSFDKIYYDGYIHKNAVILGWGVWNNIGTFLSISVPPVCLMAAKSKRGYLFLLYATLLVVCAFLTGSRQAMIGSTLAYIICAIALIIKSRTRLINIIIMGVTVLTVIIVVAVKWDSIYKIITMLLEDVIGVDGNYTGNGRMRLINTCLEYFKAYPVFGSGFFIQLDLFELVGIKDTLIPSFAHNTIAEIMATCGILGLAAYLFHRVATLIGFFKKPSHNKFYIVASILTLLFICLFDNYIFYLLPTTIYASMLKFAIAGENKKDEEKQADPPKKTQNN